MFEVERYKTTFNYDFFLAISTDCQDDNSGSRIKSNYML